MGHGESEEEEEKEERRLVGEQGVIKPGRNERVDQPFTAKHLTHT